METGCCCCPEGNCGVCGKTGGNCWPICILAREAVEPSQGAAGGNPVPTSVPVPPVPFILLASGAGAPHCGQGAPLFKRALLQNVQSMRLHPPFVCSRLFVDDFLFVLYSHSNTVRLLWSRFVPGRMVKWLFSFCINVCQSISNVYQEGSGKLESLPCACYHCVEMRELPSSQRSTELTSFHA